MNSDLLALFRLHFGRDPEEVVTIKAHASNRQIYRLRLAGESVIGVFNPDPRENKAFVGFTRHFASFGLPVPEILCDDLFRGVYLEQDLGDETLMDALNAHRGQDDEVPPAIEALYVKAVQQLPKFQVIAGKTLNYDLCYPTRAYDRKAMLWDMYYFRDSFLRRTGVTWHNSALEQDCERFADFLAQANVEHFMYRDFQARNVMIHHGEPWFIDYQGGHHGPLQYDIASLLYQSRAALPAATRSMILGAYLDALQEYAKVDREEFLRYFYGFVLIRLMQVLGTYGDKGLGEKREYFIKSIPYAVKNLKTFLETTSLPFHLPALSEVFHTIIAMFGKSPPAPGATPLRLKIFSFSYRVGMPTETSEHGGGFVFDCRSLPNPGREAQYCDKTGLDSEVDAYFKQRPQISQFFDHVFALIDQSVENYLARGFASLSVGFGCTGGQHRSVYCAEAVARHVKEKYNIESDVRHYNLERIGLLPEARKSS